MLKFSLLRIPIIIEGWFWISTVLLGGGTQAHSPEDWQRVGIWTGVVFVSILVHEFGHALAGRKFGATPIIRLQGFGGVTILPGATFSRAQKIWVSAAGPVAGFGLGALVWLVERAFNPEASTAQLLISYALYVNVFWTFVNLLPIQPLDGGQILAEIMGPARSQTTALISFLVAALLCLLAFLRGYLISAVMLGLLAYYNYRRQPISGGVITPCSQVLPLM